MSTSIPPPGAEPVAPQPEPLSEPVAAPLDNGLRLMRDARPEVMAIGVIGSAAMIFVPLMGLLSAATLFFVEGRQSQAGRLVAGAAIAMVGLHAAFHQSPLL